MRSELGYSIDEWDAVDWDHRVVYLNGLAQKLQVDSRVGGTSPARADSSPVDSLGDVVDATPDRLAQLGIQSTILGG